MPAAYGLTSCEYRTWIGEHARSNAAPSPAAAPNQRRASSAASRTVAVPAATEGRRRAHSGAPVRSMPSWTT